MTYHESLWIAAKAVAPVPYHEAFWIAASAVAPVIALAAIVGMSDALGIVGDATRAVASIEYSRAVAQIEAEHQAAIRGLAEIREGRVAEGEALILGRDAVQAPDNPLDTVAKGEAQDTRKWSLIAGSGTLLNLAIQAFLLAVSLWALVYHHDVILPWVAIILGIGGIVLLAYTAVVAAVERYNLKSPLLGPKRGGQSTGTET